jgi:hypothetical protein
LAVSGLTCLRRRNPARHAIIADGLLAAGNSDGASNRTKPPLASESGARTAERRLRIGLASQDEAAKTLAATFGEASVSTEVWRHGDEIAHSAARTAARGARRKEPRFRTV